MKNSMISKLFISLSMLVAFSFASSNAIAGETVAKGEFVGKSDHITTGAVTIKKVANGYLVKLGKDFSLDGAPAPRVGFGKDGKYDTNAQLGELVSKTGQQVYLIPANVNVSDYNEVYIWCEKFSVPLGVATLK